MKPVVRLGLAILGLLLAGFYAASANLHVGFIDGPVGGLSDFLARTVYAKVEINDDLLKAVKKEFGPSFKSDKIRILFLGIPEQARWDDNAGYDQILEYADSIPDSSDTNSWVPSSYTLSGSYGTFLYAIDPDKKVASSQAEENRTLQKDLLISLEQQPKTAPKSQTVREGIERSSDRKKLLTPHPTISDVSKARDSYQNAGNWHAKDVPEYSVYGSLKDWKNQAVSQQTFLVRSRSQDVQIGASAGSSDQRQSGKASDRELRVADMELSAARFNLFFIQPGKWFNREVISTYRNGYWLDGAPNWGYDKFFGHAGMMTLLPRAFIVAQRTTTLLRMSPADFATIRDALARSASLTVGGVPITSRSAISFDDANNIVAIQSGDDTAFIVAVVAEVLP
jgi:hypothetical protein